MGIGEITGSRLRLRQSCDSADRRLREANRRHRFLVLPLSGNDHFSGPAWRKREVKNAVVSRVVVVIQTAGVDQFVNRDYFHHLWSSLLVDRFASRILWKRWTRLRVARQKYYRFLNRTILGME